VCSRFKTYDVKLDSDARPTPPPSSVAAMENGPSAKTEPEEVEELESSRNSIASACASRTEKVKAEHQARLRHAKKS